MTKRPIVSKNRCRGMGFCISIAPDVFELDRHNKAEVKNPTGADESVIQTAIDECPTKAIKWEEEVVAEDLMTRDVITVNTDDTLYQAAEILARERFNHLPVVNDENELQGIITTRDIAFALGEGKEKISEFMTTDLITCSKEEGATSIARKMHFNDMSGLPVVNDDGKIEGIITPKDIHFQEVRTLLEVSGEIKIEEVRVSETIKKVISKYKESASERGVMIEQKEIDCKVRGGPLLEHLFSNIIENSIQHPGCENIRIYGEETDEKCTIIIEDDGEGIPDEHSERIFERGYRIGKANISRIGLFLAKEIAEVYDAIIEVRGSELGGVRFDVHFQKA